MFANANDLHVIEGSSTTNEYDMQATILPPRPEELLGPLLASLPAASISPQPPTALLPLLSPILRQRVQLLSNSSQEPWLPLLCYDSAKASKLETVVKHERLEPHPVSGEVEVDWESEVEIRYKRIDEETLQSQVSLRDLDLCVQLVWCVNDEIGGGDGWRIGEVNVLDSESSKWGQTTLPEAESAFKTSAAQPTIHPRTNGRLSTPSAEENASEDDDDDYWAQYDNTPARTPAPKDSPAPQASSAPSHEIRPGHEEEDSYYAQYASVQPAMDNHDPDEAQQNGDIESSLGRDEITAELQQNLSNPPPPTHPDLHNTSEAWSRTEGDPAYVNGAEVAHPRPSSSAGSSDTVARLEREAEKGNGARAMSEVGIKQHISTSMKSLYRLAKVAGIDRAEFERIVTTELECLSLMDEDDA